MKAIEAYGTLLARGYTGSQADLACARALTHGSWALSRHRVSYDEKAGGYQVVPVPWDGEGQQDLTPAQQVIANAPEELDDLLHTIEAVDTWLDATVAETYKRQPLAQDWARVAKIAEEAGEAVDALIGMSGQNPRKGVHKNEDDLLSELADVACTALFAIQHFTKDEAATWAVLTRAMAKARNRVPAAPEKGGHDVP